MHIVLEQLGFLRVSPYLCGCWPLLRLEPCSSLGFGVLLLVSMRWMGAADISAWIKIIRLNDGVLHDDLCRLCMSELWHCAEGISSSIDSLCFNDWHDLGFYTFYPSSFIINAHGRDFCWCLRLLPTTSLKVNRSFLAASIILPVPALRSQLLTVLVLDLWVTLHSQGLPKRAICLIILVPRVKLYISFVSWVGKVVETCATEWILHFSVLVGHKPFCFKQLDTFIVTAQENKDLVVMVSAV